MHSSRGILSHSQPIDKLAIILITIIIGSILQCKSVDKSRRGYVGSFAGVLVIILYCGWQGLFTLLSVMLYAMWKILPEKIQQRTTCLTFALIIATRLLFGFSLQVFGLPTSHATVANTIHMLVSLRCISLMYEIQYSRNKEYKMSSIATQKLDMEPTLMQSVCYFVYLPAICTLPFYTYQTYKHHIEMSTEEARRIPKVKIMLAKGLEGVMLVATAGLLRYTIGTKLIDGIYEYQHMYLLSQYFHLLVSMLTVSSALYAMWRMGEISCIAFGLGAYQQSTNPGQGPTGSTSHGHQTVEWNFNTICNGNGHLWFTMPSFTQLCRSWNSTVHWWLLRYCYTNQYLLRYTSFTRYFVTQVINASWHGSSTGYFAGLCGYSIFAALEILFETEARKSQLLKFLQRFIFVITMGSLCNALIIVEDFYKVKLLVQIAYKPSICLLATSFALTKCYKMFNIAHNNKKVL